MVDIALVSYRYCTNKIDMKDRGGGRYFQEINKELECKARIIGLDSAIGLRSPKSRRT